MNAVGIVRFIYLSCALSLQLSLIMIYIFHTCIIYDTLLHLYFDVCMKKKLKIIFRGR